jgi:hypothetical protein
MRDFNLNQFPPANQRRVFVDGLTKELNLQVRLKIILIINAFATTAAGVVLFVSPDLIGGTAGLRLPASANFIYGLLEAAEFGLSTLCWLALGFDESSALRAGSLR